MIQFNLLPDVKLEFIKARRLRRMVVLVSSVVAGTSLLVMILLVLAVTVFQRQHITNLGEDIANDTKRLQDIKDLDKVLTIQNQLNSLPELHKKKPVTSRLLGYMQQVTPANVTIASTNLDFAGSTMTITGSADSLESINRFADTLKFTTYTTEGTTDEVNAFTQVVLASFGKDEKGASYTINLVFAPVIFDDTKTVELRIPPGKITTRSETEQPTELFQPLSNPVPQSGEEQ